jgi:hypothetical protein
VIVNTEYKATIHHTTRGASRFKFEANWVQEENFKKGGTGGVGL